MPRVTRDEAIALFRSIPDGTGSFRAAYRARFQIGSMAERVWHHGEFTLGVEYGMLIALCLVFDLRPGDIWPINREEDPDA